MIHNKDQSSIGQPLQAMSQAALAGTVATVPMTIFMLATQRFLPEDHRYHLPPEILTREFSQRANLNWHHSKPRLLGTTLLSHLGYGAAMGVIYTPLEEKAIIPPPWQGTLFGLSVWAVSYIGLLPLTGFSPTAHREPLLRNLMMMAAHVVWGAGLGVTTAFLRRRFGEVQSVAQRYPRVGHGAQAQDADQYAPPPAIYAA
jgi:putative membrane protein